MQSCLRHFLPPFLFFACTLTAFAETLTCKNGIATVHSTEADLLPSMCAATDAAIETLSACELQLPETLELTTLPSIEAACLGLYHCGEGRIEVLLPDAMDRLRQPDSLFAHLPRDRLFQSVIVHEFAHAAYDVTPCPFRDCVATSEYYAYAIQLLSMTAEDRKTIERAAESGPPASYDAINAFVLYMSPDRFVTLVWDHLGQRADPCGYLQRVSSGEIVFDRFHP